MMVLFVPLLERFSAICGERVKEMFETFSAITPLYVAPLLLE